MKEEHDICSVNRWGREAKCLTLHHAGEAGTRTSQLGTLITISFLSRPMVFKVLVQMLHRITVPLWTPPERYWRELESVHLASAARLKGSPRIQQSYIQHLLIGGEQNEDSWREGCIHGRATGIFSNKKKNGYANLDNIRKCQANVFANGDIPGDQTNLFLL